jgi:hypothetical protein
LDRDVTENYTTIVLGNQVMKDDATGDRIYLGLGGVVYIARYYLLVSNLSTCYSLACSSTLSYKSIVFGVIRPIQSYLTQKPQLTVTYR